MKQQPPITQQCVPYFHDGGSVNSTKLQLLLLLRGRKKIHPQIHISTDVGKYCLFGEYSTIMFNEE